MTITDYDPQPLPTSTGYDDLAPEDNETDEELYENATFEELSAAPNGKPRSRSSRGGAAKLTSRTVRAVLAKHAELDAASADDLRMLSTALGVKDDVDELVAHILSTPRLSLAGVSELEQIVDAARVDPFEAMARAMQFEGQSKAIWGILSALRLVEGNRPAKESESSVAIARAAASFADAHVARITAIRDLARKGV